MELTLTPEAEAVLQQELRNGKFKDSNELIATALLTFSDTTPANLEDLDAMIDEGIEAAAGGISTPKRKRELISARCGLSCSVPKYKLSVKALRYVADIVGYPHTQARPSAADTNRKPPLRSLLGLIKISGDRP